ncbi:hypothetical protein [Klebsiella pasteurii]|uniref:hypothetical protein n=1 Tax=Klebsiella pasteurii TaxID=2587529 RepID=UPI0032E78BF4
MNANLEDLFSSSLKKIESLEIQKIDSDNFSLRQKSIGVTSHLSITNNDGQDIRIQLTVDLKQIMKTPDITKEFQGLISRIHQSDINTPCRLFFDMDGENNISQKLSITHIDYPDVFREKSRPDELKEKDFIIIILSMFNELFNSVKYILNYLNKISLKSSNKESDYVDGEDHEEK